MNIFTSHLIPRIKIRLAYTFEESGVTVLGTREAARETPLGISWLGTVETSSGVPSNNRLPTSSCTLEPVRPPVPWYTLTAWLYMAPFFMTYLIWYSKDSQDILVPRVLARCIKIAIRELGFFFIFCLVSNLLSRGIDHFLLRAPCGGTGEWIEACAAHKYGDFYGASRCLYTSHLGEPLWFAPRSGVQVPTRC